MFRHLADDTRLTQQITHLIGMHFVCLLLAMSLLTNDERRMVDIDDTSTFKEFPILFFSFLINYSYLCVGISSTESLLETRQGVQSKSEGLPILAGENLKSKRCALCHAMKPHKYQSG